MAEQKKPRGYIERVLFIDCETSGLSFVGDDPTINPDTGEEYQAVSWGLVVADARTLKEIDHLYVLIKWNGTSKWDKRAQAVHGLSLDYLEENGVDEEEAAALIAEIILKHWGPDSPVCLGGHNVATFDKMFLRSLMKKFDIPVKFGSKTIDTNAIGFAVFGTHNSDDLFEAVGCAPRDPEAHDALVDARNALHSVRVVRQVSKQCFEG